MENSYEVIVYGATPGGIGAAIAAARHGRRTLLIEPSPYIGGMMTSGLGRTDIRSLDSGGSIYREFTEKVLAYYTNQYGAESPQVKDCHGGMFFEPSLAKLIFDEMLDAESNLEVVLHSELVTAHLQKNRIHAVTIDTDRRTTSVVEGLVFIDCTYEGDLAAQAGTPYLIGRESRDDWSEEFAGKLYMNYDESKAVFPGSTGEGDERVQAFNYRLCITDIPENRVDVSKPALFKREDYISLLEDVQNGRVKSIRDVLNILPIPNGKTDSNNHHYCMCSSDLPEENGDYLEGNAQTREAIKIRHRDYLQGLLWFLQNEEALPLGFREEARQWGYAKDEFTDTDHFPPQLYIREGRRMVGEYTFTENDARLAPGLGRSPIQPDSIAVGDYPIDSHATRKREPLGKNVALEGFLGIGWLTEIYQIPYGIIVPKQIDGLLVPVAVSATHMGFGTIRMEPCWMQLGFAAGIAANLCIEQSIEPRRLSVDHLQDELLANNQFITVFNDMDLSSPAGKACQYFGAKGFFTSYEARAANSITVTEASQLITLAKSLPGGRPIPVLPATDRVLKAGVDMGPRFPMEELAPQEYWERNRLLSRKMAQKWLQACITAKLADLRATGDEEDSEVSYGEMCEWLYALLKHNRK